jgi:hypothetical protein
VIHNTPGAPRHATELIFERVIKDGLERGQGYADVQVLDSIVSKAGFGSVSLDVFSSERDSTTHESFNQAIMGALSGIIQKFEMADDRKGFWSSDTAVDMYQRAASELTDAKIYFRVEMWITYAQKPCADQKDW